MNKTIYIPDSVEKTWQEAQRILARRGMKISEFIVIKVAEIVVEEYSKAREIANEEIC